MESLTAAGGVVFHQKDSRNEPLVLLIYRRGVWDLPKGKQEQGEDIKGCAVREVAEEVGLSDFPAIVGNLNETYHEYKLNGQSFGKTTHWFAMTIDHSLEYDFTPQSEEDIEQVQWDSLTEAREKVGYDNLVEVLNVFKEWYKAQE